MWKCISCMQKNSPQHPALLKSHFIVSFWDSFETKFCTISLNKHLFQENFAMLKTSTYPQNLWSKRSYTPSQKSDERFSIFGYDVMWLFIMHTKAALIYDTMLYCSKEGVFAVACSVNDWESELMFEEANGIVWQNYHQIRESS